MATIDTAKALADKVLAILTIMIDEPSLALNFSTNPIGFLFQILKSIGVKSEKLEEFFINMLIWVMPALEISAKAILLTNLKKMISCSIDPRIPEKFRKIHSTATDYNTVNRYGIDINIESIDMFDKLSINPLSDAGKNWYFGLEGVQDVYKFARADDFDAFLWFVIHKGKFPNPAKIKINDNTFIDRLHGIEQATVTPKNGTLLSALQITKPSNGSSKILPGNTFGYEESENKPRVLSMCIDAQRNEKNEIVSNTLVPVSDDRSSVNWYIRRADQLGKNLGWGWQWSYGRTKSKTMSGKLNKDGTEKRPRDFSKERAICNLQYMGMVDDSPITGLVNNKIRFTILPKPLIHIPDVSQGEPPWRFKRMLFNAQGEYDPNGKYTIVAQDSNSNTYANGAVTIDMLSGKVTTNPAQLIPQLIECYPGLTVYEFNYDYVMGMRLFDAKSLFTAIVDLLINIRVGVNIKMDTRHKDFSDEIREAVKKLVMTDDSVINNCYHTFDNSKYDALLQKAQERKARQHKFGNTSKETGAFNSVSEILAEYDAITDPKDIDAKEQILHRAVRETASILTTGSDPEESNEIEVDFVYDLIENLVTAIVDALLSPKVMMLLEVNQQLMGGSWEPLTFRDVITAFRSIIDALVKEVRDLILQELLKFTLDELGPLFMTFSSAIVRERLEDLAEAMQEAIRNCPFFWFKFGNQYEEAKLDTVDYADIDVSGNKEGEKPSTNNC
jgi:hypothetical protein